MKISKRFRQTSLAAIIFAVSIAGCSSLKRFPTKTEQSVVYAICPYQDEILPVVGEKEGWYKEKGLSVKLKVLDEGDVMPALAGGAVDLALQDFDIFQTAAESINGKGGDVIFYYPLYIFRGGAIMIRGDGKLKPFSEFLKKYPNDRKRAVLETVKQLKGKTIFVTQGTDMEHLVLAAMERASLKPDLDVKLVHAAPSDSLAAFLRGDGDGFSGGVTQRTEASRRGAIVMIGALDLRPPDLVGIVTTRRFAQAHPDILNALVQFWFKTIRYMQADLDHRSPMVTNYLSTVGSTKYTTDEFKYTWFNTELYYKTPSDAAQSLLNPRSVFYWKNTWDAINGDLLKQKKIKAPIPYDDFWGEKVQKELTAKEPPQ